MTEKQVADHIRAMPRADMTTTENVLQDADIIAKYVELALRKDFEQARKLIPESKDFSDLVSKVRKLP